MPTVEVNFEHLRWPDKCCRCGSPEFTWRTHSDDVVIRTLLSVTESRKVSLEIPVCNRCARAAYMWFGAAIALGGVGWLIASFANESDALLNVVMVAFVLAVVAAIVGVRKKPIKILKFDEKDKTISIKIYDDEVAKLVQQSREMPRTHTPLQKARGR